MKAQEIKTGRVLVDFYADWCGPCRMLSKQLEQYEAEVTDVKVVKVNTIRMQGKKKRVRGKMKMGKTARRKKAIVSLREGDQIDFEM